MGSSVTVFGENELVKSGEVVLMASLSNALVDKSSNS